MDNQSIEGIGSILRIPIPPVPKKLSSSQITDGFLRKETKASVETEVEDKFFRLLYGIIKGNIKNIPRFFSKNYKWLLGLVTAWVVLWLNPYSLVQPFKTIISTIQNLPFMGVVRFLIAGYNGFVAKAIFIGVVNGIGIPLFNEIRKGNLSQIIQKYKQTLRVIIRSYKSLGKASITPLLICGGVGLAFSNLLTRNNGIDKYFICLVFSYSIFHGLSNGTKNMVARLFSAGYAGVLRLIGKSKRPSLHIIYIALTSLSLGTALNFIPGFFKQNWTEPHGYILGGLCIIAGIALNWKEITSTLKKSLNRKTIDTFSNLKGVHNDKNKKK